MARGRPAKKSATPGATVKAPSKMAVPEVYQDMLADVASSSPSQVNEESRAVKRRRVGGRIVTQKYEEQAPSHSEDKGSVAEHSDLDELFEDVKPNQQLIVETDSNDSAESDMDWEEVQVEAHALEEGIPEPDGADEEGLNLVLDDLDEKRKSEVTTRPKRKPLTIEDRKLRLEIHKMHLCCLLAHVHIRNHWCNDEGVYTSMRKVLTKKMISYLNPDEDKTQFQRSRSFMDGLTQSSEAFRGAFRITARGMSKSRWADSPETLALLQPPADIDLPMQIADFRAAAQQLEGSRDVGAQLYCAMLRSAGADARIVCSLQPLPYQPAPRVEFRQVKHHADKMTGRDTGIESARDPHSAVSAIDTSPSEEIPASFERRSASPAVELLSTKMKRKPVRESKYPVYWVEVFNEAVQKWVPVDPLVTKSIAKPAKFEPPAGEGGNGMSYVIGFEDDGSARDITKRYVKAYNAKTRKERVEVSNGGERWWRRVTKMYRRPYHMDRDQLEDAEMATKEAAEPMPKNVQDFKDHPYYALERHLKRHEALHPKREVGKVGSGRAGGTSTLEPIYRRRDVHLVKSADKWYRLGREIKPGEQTLKRVPARRTRQQSIDPDTLESFDDDNAGTALYAAHQTTIYSAPPVVHGLIPKNTYGNLDIYVSSMVPPGGYHVPHPETAKAARILGVDYADAITGFSFKGRHGTAIVNGAVVASEYRAAIEEVIWAFENDRARAEEERRSQEALKMWKRLLAGLRIRQRIEGYDIEGEKDATLQEQLDQVEDEDQDINEAGGFLPDRQDLFDAQPTAGRLSAPHSPIELEGDEGGGFLAEEVEDDPMIQQETTPLLRKDPFIDDIEEDVDGGFLVNDEDADAEEVLQSMRSPQGHDPRTSEASPKKDPDLSAQTAVSETFEPPPDTKTNEPSRDDDTVQEKANKINDEPAYEISSKMASDQADRDPSHVINSEPANESSDFASAGLSPQDVKEARLLEHLHASYISPQHPTSSHIEDDVASDPSLHSRDAPSDGMNLLNENVALDTPDKEPTEAASSESENGSLLSHDPEDEDAEPEWLT